MPHHRRNYYPPVNGANRYYGGSRPIPQHNHGNMHGSSHTPEHPKLSYLARFLQFVFALCLVGIVAIVIAMFKTRNSIGGGAAYGTPEYALFKNTNFSQCASAPLEAVDCAALRANGFGQGNVSFPGVEQGGFVLYSRAKNYTSDDDISSETDSTLGWCEMMSCFSDFKVLPSTPKPSALKPSNISVWMTINITALVAATNLRKFASGDKALRPGDGLVVSYVASSTVFWWAMFFRWATNPAYYAANSLVSWISVWQQAYISERLADRRSVRTWILWILTGLQAIGACVQLGYNWGQFKPTGVDLVPRYDCLQSGILGAPGNSSCSAEQLCSKSWLYSAPQWDFDLMASMSDGSSMLAFCWGFIKVMLLCVVIPSIILFGLPILAPLILFVIQLIAKGPKTRDEPGMVVKVSRVGGYFFALLFGLVAGIAMFATIPKGWNADAREATIAYDLNCTAVHVTISQWRSYYDIPDDRVLRIAQELLNV
ncbi:hypothetical protein PFICI_04687 [Pestalotiopsis fici W106-1]|uniref:Uncharacterized protein n=1 Tax=Pestalotiopsis fici (strain W106-1 / CGMCC3.15140) TaxID=1229662 RepID=W3XCB8_PESFW|nr:uncharacterized protein PFICI_04687 [Pestalotiopsis fici W106-1]ETS82811.1 hypothetical protein PFICI_04687 [Pestalotiopsis fici W106-1]